MSNFTKPSLILQYCEGPYQWAGIELGKTTKEETKNILLNLDIVNEDTLHEGSRFSNIDIALFIDFIEGYREESLSVWFIDEKAQFIEFFGNQLTLEEIQKDLGNLEKIAVYMEHYETIIVRYEGFSLQSGYIITGAPEGLWFNIDEDLKVVNIDKDSTFTVYLTHPGFFDEYYVEGSDFWNYFFEEDGFQDWHGYGEYEVQRPDFLN